MSAETKHTNATADDIDLLLLFERILIFFRKYKWTFLIASVLGLASGIFVYCVLPTIYGSRLVAHSFLLTNQEHIKIIENWNDLLRKKEYSELSASLEVNVTDNAILDDLQKAIVYGLENSQYVNQRLSSRRSNLEELIEKTTAEMGKLDSTKKTVEDIIEGKGRSSSPLIIGGATINNQLIDMNEKLLSYKDELKFIAAIQIFQGFSKFDKPIGPHLIPWLIIGLLFFLSLAFLFSFLHSINSKLKERSLLSNQATRGKNY